MTSSGRRFAREIVAVALAATLVVAAFVVPHLHLGIVTPLINATPARFHDFAGTAPIFGWWKAHVGWGTLPAIVIGACAVLWTSHNMYEVQEVCDRVLFLSRGRLLLQGDPKTLPAEHGQATLEDLFVTVAREPLAFAQD